MSCDDENLFMRTGKMSALGFSVSSDGGASSAGATRAVTHVLDTLELEGHTFYLACTVTDIDESAETAATRGTPIYTDNLSSVYGQFNVSAYVNGNLSTPLTETDEDGNAPATGTPKEYVGIDYVYDGTYGSGTSTQYLWKTTATSSNGDLDFYWPKDKTVPLTFYAYAPTQTVTSGPSWTGLTPSTDFKTGGVIQFDYTVPSNVTNTTTGKRVDAEGQPDILLASIPSIKRTDSGITNVKDDSKDFCIAPLTFYHALTAVDFKVGAALKRGVTINSLTLSGLKAEGKCTFTPPTTSGKHSADVIAWDFTGVTGNTGSYCQTYDQSVPATAPATDPALGSTNQTFMLIPQTFGPSGNAPAAKVTITYNGDQTKTVALHDADDVSWLAGKKYTYTLTGDLEGFDFRLNYSSDAVKTIDDPKNTPVKTVQIVSTKGTAAHDWVIKSVNGTAVGSTTYTISDRLKIEKDGENLKVTDQRPKGSLGDNDHWTDPSCAWYSQSWGTDGLNKGTIDLSKYDFESDTYSASSSMSTANCYVVRHAGTYRIPLVYGNAIASSSTYNPGVTGTNVLSTFTNHLGKNIIDPYIENNTNDGQAKYYTPAGKKTPEKYNTFISAASAKLVWSDDPDVITVTSDIQGTQQGSNTSTGSVYNSGNVRYIKFTISQADIHHNNAVIAIYDGPNGTGDIMWSWHIWVTNDPALSSGPVTASNGTQSYSFLRLPCIGWKEPEENLYDAEDDVVIVLEQADSEMTTTVTIKQPECKLNIASNGVWYQWGRKDPMRGIVGNGYSLSVLDTPATPTLADGIKNPGTFFMRTNGDWCSSKSYVNLWAGKYTSTDLCDQSANMIKTIYDPSPVGYQVPAPNAFLCDGQNGFSFTAAGYCDRKKGVKGAGSSKYYWSSVTNSSDVKTGRSFKAGDPAGTNNKSEGFAVRPVTE